MISNPLSSHQSQIGRLSDLIGLIYDLASDEDVWPQLLQALTDYVAQTSSGQVAELVNTLGPHFVRAHQLIQDVSQAETDVDTLDEVINQLPLGVAVVDEQGKVLHMNRVLLSMLRGNAYLRLDVDHLVSEPATALPQALGNVFKQGSVGAPVRLGELGDVQSILMWGTRLVNAHVRRQENLAMVVVASQQQRALTEEGLRSLFDLTPAEARLVQYLCMGRTLEEASLAQGVSTHTSKTQLKHVFSKMGVKRQAELVQTVYSSPLWLSSQTLEPPSQSWKPLAVRYHNPDHVTHSLRMLDGRVLTYFDRGDPNGIPLIFMHGLVGSRHLGPPDEEVLHIHGIRLIVPDRPGCGDSDSLPDRSIADWADDMKQLADHLQLQTFHVLGCSTGAAYALACSKYLNNRVTSAVLVGAVPPFEQLVDLRDYYAPFRNGLMVARYIPNLLPQMYQILTKGIRKNVHRYLSETLLQAPASDREPFSDARLRTNCAAAIMDGTSRGATDFMHEMLLSANDWGFSLDGIACPMKFWHGDSDQIIALEGAKRLAKYFKQAQFQEVAGAGHYLVYSHWSEILRELK